MTSAHDPSPPSENDASLSNPMVTGMGEGSISPVLPVASASPPRRRHIRRWLLLFLPVLAVGGIMAASLSGDARIGINQLPGAISAIIPAKAPQGADNCVRCHDAQAKGAALYLAVDGTILTGNTPVAVRAGDTLEVAFHFSGLLGDPLRRGSVGAQIVVPEKPLWRVVAGTRVRPREWGPAATTAAAFWSPSWDNGGNGDGPQYLRWTSSGEAPGRYFLQLVGTPFAISELASHGAVLPDRGKQDSSDRDGVANHSGVNAIIVVPDETPPGSYSVEVYGIGYGTDGKRANISKTVKVEVGGAGQRTTAATSQQDGGGTGPTAEGGTSSFVPGSGSGRRPVGTAGVQTATGGQSGDVASTRPASAAQSTQSSRPPGTILYQAKCGGCHGGNPNGELVSKGQDVARKVIVEGTKQFGGKMPPMAKSAGGTLTDEEIDLLVDTLISSSKIRFGIGPNIPHGLDGREGKCDWCHGQGMAYPKPAVHDVDYCTDCHLAPPRIPHSVMGREVCNACHTMP